MTEEEELNQNLERKLEFEKVRLKVKSSYERRRRITNVALAFFVLASIIAFALQSQIITRILGITEFQYDKEALDIAARNIIIIGALFVLMSILILFYQYLNDIKIWTSELPPSIEDQLNLAAETIFRAPYSSSSNSVSNEERANREDSDRNTPTNIPLSPNLHIGPNALNDQYERTIQRIAAEIKALDRRGNVNLIIGVGTTLTAVAILASTIFYEPATNQDKLALVTHFAPRVTLSAFIEFFSFFFLRLYSVSLQDIKYYQNELTNVESKSIALRRAIELNDKTSLVKILIILAQTERNHILKKGETTLDLERLKQSQQNERDLFNAVVNVSKMKSSEK